MEIKEQQKKQELGYPNNYNLRYNKSNLLYTNLLPIEIMPK